MNLGVALNVLKFKPRIQILATKTCEELQEMDEEGEVSATIEVNENHTKPTVVSNSSKPSLYNH